jgi:uncharacterized protein (DUF3084 family)
MGCCGKPRKRFLNKKQRQIEINKKAETKADTLAEIHDDQLTPRQQQIKARAKRIEQRNIRIARRNARIANEKKSTK